MEVLPESFAQDRSMARQTVANALARVQAMGVEPSAATVRLYELYADGDLTPAQLHAAFVELHRLAPLPQLAAP